MTILEPAWERLRETAQQTANAISSEGVRILALKDVTNEAEVDQMVDEIVRQFGRIDVLFNNAGIAQWVKAEEMSLEAWKRVMCVKSGQRFHRVEGGGKDYDKATERFHRQHVFDVGHNSQHSAMSSALQCVEGRG
jgi:NAD(P)-dependent dehydrogenase (short-subunit alcohol dehydrogenase family)